MATSIASEGHVQLRALAWQSMETCLFHLTTCHFLPRVQAMTGTAANYAVTCTGDAYRRKHQLLQQDP